MKLLRLAVVSALAFASHARAEPYLLRLAPEATTVRFLLDATMHKVRGTAALARGEIRFDPETGAAAGEVVVDAASLETGNAKRDRDMHEKVLESGRYPEIVLEVEGFEGDLDLEAPSEIVAVGRLSIHGQGHPIRLDLRLEPSDAGLRVSTTFVVPYVAWGMENPSRFLLRVGKEVEVAIEAAGPLEPDSGAASP